MYFHLNCRDLKSLLLIWLTEYHIANQDTDIPSLHLEIQYIFTEAIPIPILCKTTIDCPRVDLQPQYSYSNLNFVNVESILTATSHCPRSLTMIK